MKSDSEFDDGYVKEDNEDEVHVLDIIWEDSHIQVLSEGWRCLWCNQEFKGRNATRAISHVIGRPLYLLIPPSPTRMRT